MKRLVTILCLSSSLSGGLGQGLINFFNNSTTLVSTGVPLGPPPAVISGAPGSYYFGLLTSPVGVDLFTFAGVYGTNQTVPGRFNGGVGVAVPGWTPGTALDFEVAGWSANLGPTFNPQWLTGNLGSFELSGFFGVSAVGTGVAGGVTATGTLPNLNLFGGATGIQTGFELSHGILIPEPSGLVLAALGAAAFLIFRRKRSD